MAGEYRAGVPRRKEVIGNIVNKWIGYENSVLRFPCGRQAGEAKGAVLGLSEIRHLFFQSTHAMFKEWLVRFQTGNKNQRIVRFFASLRRIRNHTKFAFMALVTRLLSTGSLEFGGLIQPLA